MRGILTKEVYVAKAYLLNFFFMFGIVVMLNAFMNLGALTTTMMLNMYLVVITIGFFSIDEQSGWNRYAVVLPVKRSTIVGTRYLFFFISALCMFIINMLVSTVIAIATSRALAIGETALVGSAGTLLYLLLSSVTLPVVYKLGPEKSRIAMLAINLFPLLIFSLFAGKVQQVIITASNIPSGLLLAAFAVVVLAIYLISMLVSSAIYTRHEF